jgi:hypothetical protein
MLEWRSFTGRIIKTRSAQLNHLPQPLLLFSFGLACNSEAVILRVENNGMSVPCPISFGIDAETVL